MFSPPWHKLVDDVLNVIYAIIVIIVYMFADFDCLYLTCVTEFS